ncbi:MAG TPA: right-handed parallel beta-helix repeat-containing protein [bacterium]|nr:right-handed parallel beta-helix repeat-containing protein [bacterium]
MKALIQITVLCLSLLLAYPTLAAEYHVNQDGTGDFTVIQNAIDAAVDGDTIIVHPGTYYENVGFKGKNIVLRSMDSEDWDVVEATIIDGRQLGSVVEFSGAEDEACLLSGFTMTNGSATNGGGIFGGLEDGPHSMASIYNCIIYGNTASSGGGFCGCDGRIKGCWIAGNQASGGGALYDCRGEIVRCVISGNIGAYGGAIRACDGLFANCLICDNSAPEGGAIWSYERSPTIRNCTIAGNLAEEGGGIYEFSGKIFNSIVWGNWAPEGPDVYPDDSSFTSFNSCIGHWEASGAGNISDDSLFVDAVDGDYHLSAYSPCIDTGSNSYVAGLRDVEGGPRIANRIVDMGAYEYPVGCYVYVEADRQTYGTGETAKLSIHAGSSDTERQVDVYAAIEVPGGQLFFIPSLSADMTPWIADVSLGPESAFVDTFGYELSDTALEGNYTVYSAVYEHGSMDSSAMLTDLSQTSFICHSDRPITYEVKENGSGDFKSIQKAIDAARDGDTVIVHPGTYYENIQFGGRNVTLRSTDPSDSDIVSATIIDGQELGPVVAFDGTEDETCQLAGMTITNGWSEYGGGVWGASKWTHHAKASILNCAIESNSAECGAGIAACDGLITECAISNNCAGEYGGGLYGCQGIIQRCSVFINTGHDGGGLAGCHGEIISCEIIGNGALFDGGGFYQCSGRIAGCTIDDNWTYAGADTDVGGGGLARCHGLIEDCIISNNSAEGDGGALFVCKATVLNCTITGNRADFGAGLYRCNGTISNCIIWADNATPGHEMYSCDATITYSCIRNWTGEGNISDDPMFVPGPFGDYYLHPNSPCIDAGSQSAEEAGVSDRTTQADGTPDSGTVDMGYHYPIPGVPIEAEVFCSLNADEFAAGDVLQGFMSVENRGADVVVDIFAAIVLPDGSMVSLTQDGFGVGIWPWYSDLILPSGFAAGPEMVFELVIPAEAAPGSYTFLTAVSRAGTGSLGILSVDQCPFQIYEAVGSHYYVDGQLGDDSYDGSEGSPWKTINRSLRYGGAEADPITIHVAAGSYAASTNGEIFPLNMKSWVSVVGDSAENTILDGEMYSRHIFYCINVTGATIERLTITGGTGSHWDYEHEENGGGGIYSCNSDLKILDNIITENGASETSFSSGGGIYCRYSATEVRNNVIENNHAQFGGGISSIGAESRIVIEANIIRGNRVQSQGAGINAANPIIENNLIIGNNVGWGKAGGIYCGSFGGFSTVIDNCTFKGNYSGWGADAIENEDGRIDVRDCIFIGQTNHNIGTPTYCCVWQGYGLYSGEGNIECDPMFTTGPFGDYYLDPESPCIDAGSMSAEEAGLSDRTTQDDCTPDTGTVDMGYHYPIPAGERPIAHIDSILPNPATQHMDTIRFVGHGTDTDGAVQRHEWSSDLEGILSTNNRFSYPASWLELGSHIISYKVRDNLGVWSEAATEKLVIEAQFPRPVAYIDSISPNPAIYGRDTIEFRGHGTDKDGGIEAYQWSSNLDGVLSSEKSFQKPAAGLSLGTQTISLRVQDDDSQWSEPATERLVIWAEGTQHLYVNGQACDDLGDGSLNAPFKTISCALGLAVVSQTSPAVIHVAAGTYSATTNGEIYPLTMRSLVSISGAGADTTILDGEYSAYHIIRCIDVENVIVEDLTMTGGSAYGESEADQSGGAVYCVNSSLRIQSNIITDNHAVNGGAIYCRDSAPDIISNTISDNASRDYGAGICCVESSPTILYNTISFNDVYGSGGGVYCEGDSSPLIEQNTILNNWAYQFGAGVYCEQSSPIISSNTITYNIVYPPGTDIGGGGGICCKYSSPTIMDNTIANNHGCTFGGGILCDESSPLISGNIISTNDTDAGGIGGGICCENDSSPTIEANTITGNSSWGNGGGIYCEHSSPTIVENEIRSNSVWDDGGGMYLSQSSPTISGNTITDNRADKHGGGIHCALSSPTISNNLIIGNEVYGRFGFDGGGIYCSSHSSPSITNNTIVGNSAAESGAGGGIYSEREGNPTIEACIIWGNDDDLSGCSTSYCCIKDGNEGEGNIYGDPMFVPGPFGDYYLHPNSPCIDGGDRWSHEAGVADRTTQADGTPDTGTVDMGFHYPIPGAPIEAEVFCSLNADEFAAGDLMQAYLEVVNEGPEMTVDAFVGFILPDGSIICLVEEGFGFGLWPWAVDWVLPTGFSFGPEMVFELSVPHVEPGSYIYAAALAESGAIGSNFISVDSVPFTITGTVR